MTISAPVLLADISATAEETESLNNDNLQIRDTRVLVTDDGIFAGRMVVRRYLLKKVHRIQKYNNKNGTSADGAARRN